MNSSRVLCGAVLLLLSFFAVASTPVFHIIEDENGSRMIPFEMPELKSDQGTVRIKSKKSATFNVTYVDVANATGTGFDDPALGAERRAVFESVLSYVGSIIENTGSADIQVSTESDGSGPLATGSPLFFLGPGIRPGFTSRHITTGQDPCREDNCGTDFPDMNVTVDFGYSYNLTQTPNHNEYDLYDVLLHETLHGLGVISTSNGEGNNDGNPDTITSYQALLVDGAGNRLWNDDGTFASTSSALAGGNNGIYFTGNDASDREGSSLSVYSPSTFVQGSSLDHWSPQGSIGNIMNAVSTPGIHHGRLSNKELDVLEDLGYDMRNEKTLVYPWVSNSGDFRSTILMNNFSNKEISVTFTATRGDGSSETLEPITIAARSLLKRSAEEMFTTLGTGGGYTVKATADSTQVSGRWVTFDRNNGAPSQGVAIDIPPNGEGNLRLGKNVVLGYLPGTDGFLSAPVLVNTSSATTTVTVRYYDESSNLVDTVSQSVAPYTPWVAGVFSERSDIYGVASSTDNLTGVVFVFNNSQQTAIGNVTAVENYTP